MRIHRLEIEGFGPFLQRQTIDLDEVARDGLFLIAGKTGAGKSSILDAVCFALYGSVPRYEDGDRRLRSDHAGIDEPTRVVMEFSAADERWRVERSPSYERVKKNGVGTTTQAARARLSRWEGGQWHDIAARTVDVGRELSEVIALTKDQFLQVILLAQGRFQEFLHAHNDERQKLLRTLFGSHRFQRYEQELDERRKRAEQEQGRARYALDMQLDAAEARVFAAGGEEADATGEGADTETRLERLQRAVEDAEREVEATDAAADAAKQAHDDTDAAVTVLLAQHDKQRQLAAAKERSAELAAAAAEIGLARRRVAQAQEAEVLRTVIETAAAAATALAEATERQRQTEQALRETGSEADTELDTEIDGLVSLVARLQEASREEATLGERERAVTTATAAVASLTDRIDELARSRAAIPAQLNAVEERLRAAAGAAAGLEAATARVAAATARRDAAVRAEQKAGVLAQKEQEAAAAGRALTAASNALDELRERRFRDHAGELAERLVDGEPCSVCGSPTHPHPAARRDEPVLPEHLDVAQREKEAAVAADAAATEAETAARRALAEDRESSGGWDAERAAAELRDASADEEAARAAAATVVVLTAERDGLRAREESIDEETAAARHELEAARGTLTLAVKEESDVRERVRVARDAHDTVAARLADVAERLRLAREAAQARRDVATRAREAAEATTACEARLAASSFEDAAAATAALCDPAERAELEERVRSHDADRTATDRALAALTAEELPAEPIDTAAAVEARDRARAQWELSLRTATVAAAYHTALRDEVAAAVATAGAGAAAEAEVAAIEELAAAVAGRAHNTKKMDLETFVLAAELERIVAAANVRLEEMSDGRYLLEHSDALAAHGRSSGLGITIMDRNTGRSRPVQSLSGGETFLASLALALGLAQVVTADAGGVKLDTLFIDEGFGALDAETLEVAMRTLDELRADGRIVGVISHVEAMQATLPAGILVEATAAGPSIIRTPR